MNLPRSVPFQSAKGHPTSLDPLRIGSLSGALADSPEAWGEACCVSPKPSPEDLNVSPRGTFSPWRKRLGILLVFSGTCVSFWFWRLVKLSSRFGYGMVHAMAHRPTHPLLIQFNARTLFMVSAWDVFFFPGSTCVAVWPRTGKHHHIQYVHMQARTTP